MSAKIRPNLKEIPLSNVTFSAGTIIITMSEGQWDALLDEGYKRGHILLELDAGEAAVRAYKKS